ncbi:hypothetical protein [Amycolatopsis sp. H20-H5]|uniref:hypothetical protein n=1 Tax=Amycolatopsis sp. H20-H5 TaxID=3046309 RepID=UPI002DB784A1|nr:hypothetical protein [Amycolatopsis sp. H20-H5]MEC3982004.1 hypothetical protein [Amycolatopsis sp. H20-H5]
MEFLTDEQAESYGTFGQDPTRPELERFFFLDDEDRRLIGIAKFNGIEPVPSDHFRKRCQWFITNGCLCVFRTSSVVHWMMKLVHLHRLSPSTRLFSGRVVESPLHEEFLVKVRRAALASLAACALMVSTMAPMSAAATTQGRASTNTPPAGCANAIAAAVSAANAATAAAANVVDAATAAAAAKAFAEGVLTGTPAAVSAAAANLGAFTAGAATTAAASAAAHATAANATIGVIVACAKA